MEAEGIEKTPVFKDIPNYELINPNLKDKDLTLINIDKVNGTFGVMCSKAYATEVFNELKKKGTNVKCEESEQHIVENLNDYCVRKGVVEEYEHDELGSKVHRPIALQICRTYVLQRKKA